MRIFLFLVATVVLTSCAPASNSSTEQGSTTSSDTAPTKEQSTCQCLYPAGSALALAQCTPATAAQIAAEPSITSYENGNGCVVVR